jgi:hypothetical protein
LPLRSGKGTERCLSAEACKDLMDEESPGILRKCLLAASELIQQLNAEGI